MRDDTIVEVPADGTERLVPVPPMRPMPEAGGRSGRAAHQGPFVTTMVIMLRGCALVLCFFISACTAGSLGLSTKGQFGYFNDQDYVGFDNDVLQLEESTARVIIRVKRGSIDSSSQENAALCVEPPPNAPALRHAAFELCQSYANFAITEREYVRLFEKLLSRNPDMAPLTSPAPVTTPKWDFDEVLPTP